MSIPIESIALFFPSRVKGDSNSIPTAAYAFAGRLPLAYTRTEQQEAT
jgi:hypothetical protein